MSLLLSIRCMAKEKLDRPPYAPDLATCDFCQNDSITNISILIQWPTSLKIASSSWVYKWLL